MTFASELVRISFNQLPIDKQREFCDFEDKLALNGSGLQIDSVMRHEKLLEVVIRITEEFEFPATGTYLSNLD